jgi:hypothetical protein
VPTELQNYITDSIANKEVFVADTIPDESTVKLRHVAARLPPYHCNLNSIKMVWGQAKGCI